MKTFFFVLSLNVGRRSSKEKKSGHDQGSGVSLLLADLHRDKILLFLSWKEVYREFWAKIMQIKIAEINASLN